MRETIDFTGNFEAGGWGRNWTADTRIFSHLLYQLSYPATRARFSRAKARIVSWGTPSISRRNSTVNPCPSGPELRSASTGPHSAGGDAAFHRVSGASRSASNFVPMRSRSLLVKGKCAASAVRVASSRRPRCWLLAIMNGRPVEDEANAEARWCTLFKQARVKGKVCGVFDLDLCEISVFGIEQVVQFVRDDYARHRQDREGGGLHPSVTELLK